MAFALTNLSVLAYANGFTLWHYKAGDETAALTQDNFFVPAGDMLNAGDMIMVSEARGGKILAVTVGPAPHTLRTCPV